MYANIMTENDKITHITHNALPKSHLKIRINPDYEDVLKPYYQKAIDSFNDKIRNGEKHLDSGFDLFIPKHFSNLKYSEDKPIVVDHQVSCALYDDNYNPLPYYLYPRSSISKTPFRLANSVGIIDSGYRGNLIAKVDCICGEAYDHGEASSTNNTLGMNYVDVGVGDISYGSDEDSDIDNMNMGLNAGAGGFNVENNMFIRTINANRVGRYSNFYESQVGSRMFQVCSYNLLPFSSIEIVNHLDITTRGTGGFGSTDNDTDKHI